MTVCASLWHRGHVPFRVLVLALFCAALAPPPLAAETGAAAAAAAATAAAPAPLDVAPEPALTLRRGDQILTLSIADLAAMPQTTIVTTTEFTDGKAAYTGPLARTVLERLGLGDAPTLRFTAANDYSVEIPTRDFRAYDVILALEADGVPLTRRDMGPIWLMYPFSDNRGLLNVDYNARLIWQLIRIETP